MSYTLSTAPQLTHFVCKKRSVFFGMLVLVSMFVLHTDGSGKFGDKTGGFAMRVGVRTGLELELVGPGPAFMRLFFQKRFGRRICRRSNLRGFSYQPEDSVYESCDDECGWEITTPAYRSLRELDSLRPIVDSLRSFCWVNKTCGMHVHLSSKRGLRVDIDSFSESVWRRYGRFVHGSRRSYCSKGWSDSEFDRCYSVVLVYGNHLEVRIFNGTLDYDVIRGRVKELTELYRSHLYPRGVEIECARERREYRRRRELIAA